MFMRPDQDREAISRGNMAEPRTATMTKDVGDFHLTWHEKDRSEVFSSKAQALATVEAAINDVKAGASWAQSRKEQGTTSFVTVAEVSEIASHATNIALENLNERVIKMAEQTIIDKMECCDMDHYKVLVR